LTFRKRLDIFDDDAYEPYQDGEDDSTPQDSINGRAARLALIQTHFN